MTAEPTDLRRGFDGLAAATRSLILDPLSGHIFLFFEQAEKPDQAFGMGPNRFSPPLQAVPAKIFVAIQIIDLATPR